MRVHGRRAHWVAGLLGTIAVAMIATTNAGGTSIRQACLRDLRHRAELHPKLLNGAPPAALTTILGVLRRTATPGDKLPAGSLRTLETGAAGTQSYSSLWPGSTRLLGSLGHTRYYLVPGIYSPSSFPKPCLRQLPKHQRERFERASKSAPRGAVAALLPFDASQMPFLFPFTTADIEAGHANLFEPEGSAPAESFIAIVPDGVASVTVMVNNGPAASAPVTSNFALIHLPPTSFPETGDVTIVQQWYASNGMLVKTVKEAFRSETLGIEGAIETHAPLRH